MSVLRSAEPLEQEDLGLCPSSITDFLIVFTTIQKNAPRPKTRFQDSQLEIIPL